MGANNSSIQPERLGEPIRGQTEFEREQIEDEREQAREQARRAYARRVSEQTDTDIGPDQVRQQNGQLSLMPLARERVDRTLREEAAAGTDLFEPGDFTVGADSVRATESAVEEVRAEQRQDALSEFQSQTQVDLGLSDITQTGDGFGLTDDAAQREAVSGLQDDTKIELAVSDITQTGDGFGLSQDARQDEALASLQADTETNIDSEDITQTDDGFGLTQAARRQEAVPAFQNLTDISIDPSDVEFTDAGPTLSATAKRDNALAQLQEQTAIDISREDIESESTGQGRSFGLTDEALVEDAVTRLQPDFDSRLQAASFEVENGEIELRDIARREEAVADLQGQTQIDLERSDIDLTSSGAELTDEARRDTIINSAQENFDTELTRADVNFTENGPQISKEARTEEAVAALQGDTETTIGTSDITFEGGKATLSDTARKEEAVAQSQPATEIDISTDDIRLTDTGASLDEFAVRRSVVEQLQGETQSEIGTRDIRFPGGPDSATLSEPARLEEAAETSDVFSQSDFEVSEAGTVQLTSAAREREAVQAFLAEQAESSGVDVAADPGELFDTITSGDSVPGTFDVTGDNDVTATDVTQLKNNPEMFTERRQRALSVRSDFLPSNVEAELTVPTSPAGLFEDVASGDSVQQAFDVTGDGEVTSQDVTQLQNDPDLFAARRDEALVEASPQVPGSAAGLFDRVSSDQSVASEFDVTGDNDVTLEDVTKLQDDQQAFDEAQQSAVSRSPFAFNVEKDARLQAAASEFARFDASDLSFSEQDGQQVIEPTDAAITRERQEQLQSVAAGIDDVGPSDLTFETVDGEQTVQLTEVAQNEARFEVLAEVANRSLDVHPRDLEIEGGQIQFTDKALSQRQMESEMAQTRRQVEVSTDAEPARSEQTFEANRQFISELSSQRTVQQREKQTSQAQAEQIFNQNALPEANRAAIASLSGLRTVQQREKQRARAVAEVNQLPDVNQEVIANLSGARTAQQQTQRRARIEAADVFSEQSGVAVTASEVELDQTASGQLQPELIPSVRRDVNESLVSDVSARQTTQQRVQQRALQSAAGAYSKQVGFDVPTSAVNLESVETDDGTELRPSLDTEAAKEAGQSQDDILSGVVQGIETGATGAVNVSLGLAPVDTGRVDIDLPGEGSAANVARVEKQSGETDITDALPDTVQDFGDTLGDYEQTFSERFTQPAGDVAAFGDLAVSLDPRDTMQAFERAETAVDAFKSGNRGEAFASLSGEAQGEQTFSDTLVSSTATGATEIANLPGLASAGITAADVGATGLQAAAKGDGVEFAQEAGGAGVSLAEQATETAIENPVSTMGLVAGGALSGAALGRGVGVAGRGIRDRLRTVGGDRVDLEDLTQEDVAEYYRTGGKSGDRFPGAEDPDLYEADPPEAVRRQADQPEEIRQIFGGDSEESILTKALDVEPEGPSRGRSSQGFQSAPGESLEAFDYETPGSFVGPDVSPNFLGVEDRAGFSLRPGLPDLGSQPTTVFVRTDVDAPDADTMDAFNQEMIERGGETTARTKPAGDVNPGEVEAIIPPGAEFRDVGGGPFRNTLRRLGVGSEAYTVVQGRRVPIRGVVPESDTPDSRSFGFGTRGQAEIPGGERRGAFRGTLDDLERPGRVGTDRPFPGVPVGEGESGGTSRSAPVDDLPGYLGSGLSGGVDSDPYSGVSAGSESDPVASSGVSSSVTESVAEYEPTGVGSSTAGTDSIADIPTSATVSETDVSGAGSTTSAVDERELVGASEAPITSDPEPSTGAVSTERRTGNVDERLPASPFDIEFGSVTGQVAGSEATGSSLTQSDIFGSPTSPTVFDVTSPTGSDVTGVPRSDPTSPTTPDPASSPEGAPSPTPDLSPTPSPSPTPDTSPTPTTPTTTSPTTPTTTSPTTPTITTPTLTPDSRPRLDIDIDLNRDEDDFDQAMGRAKNPFSTDFLDPLTGDRIETSDQPELFK